MASGTTSTVMLALICATNAVALLFANVMAFRTRDLTVAFNESKFVALSMASILQAMLIGTPLVFLADTNTVAKFVVRSVIVFVICMSVLLFIFTPKILHGDKPMDPIRLSVSTMRQSALPSRASGNSSGFGSSNFMTASMTKNMMAENMPDIPFGSDSSNARSITIRESSLPEKQPSIDEHSPMVPEPPATKFSQDEQPEAERFQNESSQGEQPEADRFQNESGMEESSRSRRSTSRRSAIHENT